MSMTKSGYRAAGLPRGGRSGGAANDNRGGAKSATKGPSYKGGRGAGKSPNRGPLPANPNPYRPGAPAPYKPAPKQDQGRKFKTPPKPKAAPFGRAGTNAARTGLGMFRGYTGLGRTLQLLRGEQKLPGFIRYFAYPEENQVLHLPIQSGWEHRYGPCNVFPFAYGPGVYVVYNFSQNTDCSFFNVIDGNPIPSGWGIGTTGTLWTPGTALPGTGTGAQHILHWHYEDNASFTPKWSREKNLYVKPAGKPRGQTLHRSRHFTLPAPSVNPFPGNPYDPNTWPPLVPRPAPEPIPFRALPRVRPNPNRAPGERTDRGPVVRPLPRLRRLPSPQPGTIILPVPWPTPAPSPGTEPAPAPGPGAAPGPIPGPGIDPWPTPSPGQVPVPAGRPDSPPFVIIRTENFPKPRTTIRIENLPRTPPRPRTREKKVRIKFGAAFMAMRWVFSQFTETMDLVSAAYWAIPRHLRPRGRVSWKKKVEWVNKHWADVNVRELSKNLLKNQIEDFAYGMGGRASQWGMQQTPGAHGWFSTAGGATKGAPDRGPLPLDKVNDAIDDWMGTDDAWDAEENAYQRRLAAWKRKHKG